MKSVLMILPFLVLACGTKTKSSTAPAPTSPGPQTFLPSEPQKVEIVVKQQQEPVGTGTPVGQDTNSQPPKTGNQQPNGQGQPTCGEQPQQPACQGEPQPQPAPCTTAPACGGYGIPGGVYNGGIYGGPIVVAPPVILPMPCYKADAAICDTENILVDMINAYRASRGIAPAQGNFQISFGARAWSRQMAANGAVALTPLEPLVRVMVAEFGPDLMIGSSLLGEAVAMAATGATPQMTAQALFNALIANDIYNNSILSPAGFVGAGIVVNGAAAFVTVVTSL